MKWESDIVYQLENTYFSFYFKTIEKLLLKKKGKICTYLCMATCSLIGDYQNSEPNKVIVYPWVGKIPWRRQWQPTPASLLGKSHGQRTLMVYSPRGHKRVRHNWMTNIYIKLRCTNTEFLFFSFRTILLVLLMVGNVCSHQVRFLNLFGVGSWPREGTEEQRDILLALMVPLLCLPPLLQLTYPHSSLYSFLALHP